MGGHRPSVCYWLWLILRLTLTLTLTAVNTCSADNSDNSEKLQNPPESRPGPILTLAQGKVQGTILRTDNGADYFMFRGIPYATQQRFRIAGPPPSWDGVRDASKFGSPCPQTSFTTLKPDGAEDCLFIDVSTPTFSEEEGRDSRILRPTIVYIHGGGFQGGSGGQSGPQYWMDNGDVIFVTFNYRLGAFGFLNLGNEKDNEAVGIEPNLGLKDQVAALRWVRDNIEAFGGTKENITLFGGSAGAASVALHILSSMSSGLFSRAISGSGSSLCPWALDPNPGINTRFLIHQLGCDVMDGKPQKDEMIKQCLLDKPFQEFLGVKSPESELWSLDPAAMFQPSVEISSKESVTSSKRFLTDNPATLLANGDFNKVPWISGVTSQEGLALHSAIILNNPALVEKLNTNWENIAPITLSLKGLIPKESMLRVVTEIRKFYFGDEEISAGDPITSTKLQELYSDRNFFTGVRNAILLHAKQAPVYPYMFDYMDPNAKSWLTTLLGLNISGVAHGDDFAYYFKFYMDPTDPTSGLGLPINTSAMEMSKKLVKVLVAFAKDGIPGAEEWTKSGDDPNSMKWFHIDKHSTMKEESEKVRARMNFWNEILSSGFDSSNNFARTEL